MTNYNNFGPHGTAWSIGPEWPKSGTIVDMNTWAIQGTSVLLMNFGKWLDDHHQRMKAEHERWAAERKQAVADFVSTMTFDEALNVLVAHANDNPEGGGARLEAAVKVIEERRKAGQR